MARTHAAFAALSHEAAHRLLFPNKRVNDWVGRWVVGYPGFISTDLYRRGHMAHHKEEFGPNEPDMNLYVGYPVSRASLRRKLTRDALGISGWKNLRSVLRGARMTGGFARHARCLLGVQLGLLVAATAVGRPELYLLWFVPWMTSWRVINRLRAIAEHGGMEHSKDRRRTTHTVRQHALARFFLVPYNIGWHLAHHVDMGVPWRNLPRMHAELRASGWVPDELEHRSYPALWLALAAGEERARPTVVAG
jgi:fatty acid desaturase